MPAEASNQRRDQTSDPTPEFAYPIVLDVREMPIVIVGGGAVAARKAKALLAAGATHLRVISPALAEEFPKTIEWIAAEYSPRRLHDCKLIFAATDKPQLNAQIVRDAAAIGALANRADGGEAEADGGDFVTPAVLRAGAITVAVTTGGTPALAAEIRDLIAAQFDSRWSLLADALRQLRPRIPSASRRKLFASFPWTDALRIVAQQGVEGLGRWMEQRARSSEK